MVGVGDLDFVVEMLDQAADHPDFALGRGPAQPVLAGVEINQGEESGFVGAADAVGPPGAVRGHMGVDPHHQGRHLAGWRVGDLGIEAAIDHAAGQVPQQVDDMAADQALEQRRQPGADAGQGGHRGEEGEQALWTHAMSGAERC